MTQLLSERVARLQNPRLADFEIAQEAKRREAAGQQILNLTLGDSDQDTAPQIIATAVEALQSGRTHYTPIGGIEPLRALVAQQQAAQDGHSWSPNNVVVGPGAQNALFSALMCLCGPGDEVVSLDPVYATYQGAVNATGAELKTIPIQMADGPRLRAEDIENALSPRTRVLLINSPNNPAGLVLTAQDVALLCKVAKAHDLWIVSDEVYRDLTFDSPHIPFAEADAKRLVILNSLSKSHAMTGWRLGWAVCPDNLADAMRNLAMCSLFGSPPFIQDAAITALELGDGPVHAMRDLMQSRCRIFSAALQKARGLRLIAPEAGMFALVDISGLGLSSTEFAARLLDEESVAVIPGTAFSDNGHSYIRVSFSEGEETLQAAAAAIRNFSERCLAASAAPELEQ
ncbi:pyridoxal phosphate-dependent aminotransferase [Leisingera sp. S232]|uniref:pyridoxal phosphate-dependent aminotransferase n=1 Tax=Leisingera sp. S232 TaxID=3415132 RepID=UPI003C799C7E